MKILNKTVIAMAVLSASSLSFASYTTGGVSNGNTSTVKYVQVGDYSGTKNEYNGKASINIVYKNQPNIEPGRKTANNVFQSFKKMSSMANKPFVRLFVKSILEKTSDGVYVARMYNMPQFFEHFKSMPEHRDLGRMSFKQVGNMDVWFGDWEDVPRNSSNPDLDASKYTVYYAGTGQTATDDLPSGEVHYSITGINKHRHTNTQILIGALTANFGNSTVNGYIYRPDGSLSITFDNNRIEGAGFNGNATANGTIQGQSEGKFYGSQAAGVAGMATFASDHSKDTAFGGLKMTPAHR